MAADEIKSTGQCLDIAVIANLHSINSVYADIPRFVRNESGYPVGISEKTEVVQLCPGNGGHKIDGMFACKPL